MTVKAERNALSGTVSNHWNFQTLIDNSGKGPMMARRMK